ncbi:hypothetical protein AB5I41_03250 [Sphingomonas sp. MMS24-JH45]
MELNESRRHRRSDAPSAPTTPVSRRRDRCGTYWGFIDQFDLSVEGVSTRRLRRGIDTVAGFLRHRHRGYAAPLPIELLERSSGVLHNMMAAELLRGTVQHNSGLMAFQRLLEVPTDAARAR